MKLHALPLIAALLTVILPPAAPPAHAFYSRGGVNAQINYQDLEVYKSGYSVRVKGTLINRTNRPCYLSAEIRFCDIFDRVGNSATVRQDLPPHGQARFDTYLDKNDYKGTKGQMKVLWSVNSFRFTDPGKSPIVKGDKHTVGPQLSPGRVPVREGDSDIYIEGKGRKVSDSFHLPAGKSRFEVTFWGESDLTIELREAPKPQIVDFVDLPGGGRHDFALSVEEQGLHSLLVNGEGRWSVHIHIERERSATVRAEAAAGGRDGQLPPPPGGKIIIELTSGARFQVDDYADTGEYIQFEQYGGTIRFKRENIARIIE